MALFYKYAKALNELHRRDQTGESREELAKLAEEIYNGINESKEDVKKAQEQLVIYSPFVEKELAKPEYDGKRVSSLFFSMGLGTPEQLETYNKVLDECIKRYNISEPIKTEPGQIIAHPFTPEEKAEVDAVNKMVEEYFKKKDLEKISQQPLEQIKKMFFTLDNISTTLFDFYELNNGKGDGQMRLTTTKAGAQLIYAIKFEDFQEMTTKQFTPYDKLVFDIVGTYAKKYFDEYAGTGQHLPAISLSQIWRSMGNQGTPPSKEIQRIEKSINKMRHADITINNMKVYNDQGDNISEAKKTTYKTYNATDYLLPAGFIEETFKGKRTDKAVVIYHTPFLMKFAIDRGQFYPIEVNLLEIEKNGKKLYKTDNVIAVQQYLIGEILHIKDGKRNAHIRFNTIAEKCHINIKYHPEQLWDKIFTILDHFADKNFIKGYEIIDGVSIKINY